MTDARGTGATAGPSGAGGPGSGGGNTSGGPPLILFLLGLGGVLLGLLIVVAQILGAGAPAGAPGPGGSPPLAARPTVPPPGDASLRTRAVVAAALESRAFQVRDPQTPYRPGESPSLLAVPRRVVQVVLPNEPGGGYVVIYEFASAAQADATGRDFRAYLASGTGAIQYLRDTRFVLRRVGTTLVFFAWSPEASTDERVPEVAEILGSIGEPLTPG